MNGNYDYIIRKLGTPLYYDVYGAPHYDLRWKDIDKIEDFKEFLQYFRICICQGCGERMRVQCTHPVYYGLDVCTDHYGDPPRHMRFYKNNMESCVGNTMNVDETRELTKQELTTFILKAIHLEEDTDKLKLLKKILKYYEKEI